MIIINRTLQFHVMVKRFAIQKSDLMTEIYRYANEAERATQDIYDDFKLKTTLFSLGLYKTLSAL